MKGSRSWRRALLAAAGIGAVVGAPLAVGQSTPAAAVTIKGATNLAQSVVLDFPRSATGVTTDFQVLGFNDFHGNLEPGALNQYGQFAGGAAWLSKLIKDEKAAFPTGRTVVVEAGDNIGASPLVSGLFKDEPSTIVQNLMGVDFSTVGNHEFDRGKTELLRQQNGGCSPTGGCTAGPYALADGTTTATFPGADFQYLSTNVVDTATGATLFPSTAVATLPNGSGGTTKIGFVGLVLEATPSIVTPSGVAGLTFQNETAAANNAAAALKAQGVNTIVMLIHQGGSQTGTFALNGCAGNLAGSAIATILNNGLDRSIDVIVSGHTHNEYRCTVTTTDGETRLVTSASSFARVLTDVTLTIDDATGTLTTASANNLIVRNSSNPRVNAASVPLLDLPKDPAVNAVVQQYATAVAPLSSTVLGSISGDLTRTANTLGEQSLGDVIADSQLAATAPAAKGGSQIAFMNPGGIRADFLRTQISGTAPPEQIGQVTYGEAFTVQPFGNTLVVKTLTGQNLRELLEQQFVGCRGQRGAGGPRYLQISNGFSYELDLSVFGGNLNPPVASPPSPAACAAAIGKIFLNGAEISPTGSYRVTMNNFMADGGDDYTTFRQGTNVLGGDLDIDALVGYFQAQGTIAPGPQNRVIAYSAPVVPEAPWGVLLPLSALAIVGAVLAATQWRRRGRLVA